MSDESIKEEVKQAVDTAEKGEVLPATPEKESSKEVKIEVVKKPEDAENVAKEKEHISNLNQALKEEREEKKVSNQKISDLEKRLEETTSVIGRLKDSFSPKEEDGDEQPVYLTREEAEELLQSKMEEQTKKTEEQKKTEQITQEIKTLESEFDGSEGKPKYEDKEVLEWQKANNKLYLSPREAFEIMKQGEIIDYQVKMRLKGDKPATDVERPGGGGGEHSPLEILPKNEQETRKAILEAMENAEKEI